jgi:hypothetical protein
LVKNNALFFIANPELQRLVIPYKFREKLITFFHSNPLHGGHGGIDRTFFNLKRKFYWKGMHHDIVRTINSCLVCQLRKSPRLNPEPLHPIPPPSYPMQTIHTDILGPLPLTELGNKYILATVCAFSKWIITSPLKCQTAIAITDAFLNDVVCQHSSPETIITDNGKQFVSQIFAEISKNFGFTHKLTTFYKPSTNGQVERQNQVLADSIAAYTRSDGKDWDTFLPLITFSLNNSFNASTRQTPFYLMRLREARLPFDLKLPSDSPSSSSSTPSDFIKKTISNAKLAWSLNLQKLSKIKLSQKEKRDRYVGAKEHDINEFDLVLKKNDYVPGGKHKFSKKWSGPFRVIRMRRPNAVIRKLEEGAQPITVHLDKLKLFKEEGPLPFRPGDDLFPDRNMNEEEEE